MSWILEVTLCSETLFPVQNSKAAHQRGSPKMNRCSFVWNPVSPQWVDLLRYWALSGEPRFVTFVAFCLRWKSRCRRSPMGSFFRFLCKVHISKKFLMVYFSVLFAEAVNGFLFKFEFVFVVFSTILVVYYLNEPVGYFLARLLFALEPQIVRCSNLINLIYSPLSYCVENIVQTHCVHPTIHIPKNPYRMAFYTRFYILFVVENVRKRLPRGNWGRH